MRLLTATAVLAAALFLTGCPNPNNIGVQTYGTVAVTAVDENSGQPLSGVLISAGSTYTCSTGANGMCPSPLQLPVGTWTINASSPGLSGSATGVKVTENNQTAVTIQLHP